MNLELALEKVVEHAVRNCGSFESELKRRRPHATTARTTTKPRPQPIDWTTTHILFVDCMTPNTRTVGGTRA